MDKTPTQFLKPLIKGPEWDLLVSYLTGEKEKLVTRICKCEIEHVSKLQGQIATIDLLLNLEQQLKTEEGRRR